MLDYTAQNIPKDNNLHIRRHEKLKPQPYSSFLSSSLHTCTTVRTGRALHHFTPHVFEVNTVYSCHIMNCNNKKEKPDHKFYHNILIDGE
jgi:hypothetical protein